MTLKFYFQNGLLPSVVPEISDRDVLVILGKSFKYLVKPMQPPSKRQIDHVTTDKAAIVRSCKGAEGRGEQRRGLRTKALMRDLGTRLECRQKHCGSKSIVPQPDSTCYPRFNERTIIPLRHRLTVGKS